MTLLSGDTNNDNIQQQSRIYYKYFVNTYILIPFVFLLILMCRIGLSLTEFARSILFILFFARANPLVQISVTTYNGMAFKGHIPIPTSYIL